MTFHVFKDNQYYGPYGREQLKQYASDGKFASTDMVCKEGSTEWSTIESLLGEEETTIPQVDFNSLGLISTTTSSDHSKDKSNRRRFRVIIFSSVLAVGLLAAIAVTTFLFLYQDNIRGFPSYKNLETDEVRPLSDFQKEILIEAEAFAQSCLKFEKSFNQDFILSSTTPEEELSWKEGLRVRKETSEPFTGWERCINIITKEPDGAIRYDKGLECDRFELYPKGTVSLFQQGVIKKNATTVKWHENGRLKSYLKFSGWKKAGTWFDLYENGQFANYYVWEKDKLKEFMSWLPDGSTCPETDFNDGTGVIFHWYTNGQKKEVAHFKNGRANGLWTKWWKNGQKSVECNLTDSEEDGIYSQWSENGTLISKEAFTNGEKNGRSVFYHDNGQKKSEEFHKLVEYNQSFYSEFTGTWRTWNEEGELIDETDMDARKGLDPFAPDGAYGDAPKGNDPFASDGAFSDAPKGNDPFAHKNTKVTSTPTNNSLTGAKAQELQAIYDSIKESEYEISHDRRIPIFDLAFQLNAFYEKHKEKFGQKAVVLDLMPEETDTTKLHDAFDRFRKEWGFSNRDQELESNFIISDYPLEFTYGGKKLIRQDFLNPNEIFVIEKVQQMFDALNIVLVKEIKENERAKKLELWNQFSASAQQQANRKIYVDYDKRFVCYQATKQKQIRAEINEKGITTARETIFSVKNMFFSSRRFDTSFNENYASLFEHLGHSDYQSSANPRFGVREIESFSVFDKSNSSKMSLISEVKIKFLGKHPLGDDFLIRHVTIDWGAPVLHPDFQTQ